MSAAKHTPGPWMVSPEHPTIIRRDYRPISDCGELIGSASGHTKSGFFPSEDEAVANARLIAAAPEVTAWGAALLFAIDGLGDDWNAATIKGCLRQPAEQLREVHERRWTNLVHGPPRGRRSGRFRT